MMTRTNKRMGWCGTVVTWMGWGCVLAVAVVAGCTANSSDSDSDSDADNDSSVSWMPTRVDDAPSITPVAVRIYDMDGDGKLDIVSAWRGDGDPLSLEHGMICIHFQEEDNVWDTVIVDGGSRYAEVNALAIGDMNRDDTPDIMVAAMDRILFLSAPSNPRLAENWASYTVNDSMGTDFNAWYDVAIGQIDKRYGPDVVAACADSGQLVWFKGPANPDISSAEWAMTVIDNTTREQCDSVLLTDVNDDGRLDVISTAPGEATGVVSWYEQPSDPDGLAWSKHPMSNFAGATRMALGDLDGDNLADLAVISPTDRRVAWLIQPRDVEEAWDGYVLADFSSLLSQRTPVDVAIADINQDGDNDVVIATTSSSTLSWFEPGANNRNAWTEHQIAAISLAGPGLIAVDDVGGDGDIDVAVPLDDQRDSYDRISVYESPIESAASQPS